MAKILDPYEKRESMRYPNPIPSRELILQVLQERGKPATAVQLQKLLRLKKGPFIDAFSKRLSAMERDGQLIRNRKDEYGLISKMNLISGRVTGHRDGYGFVIADEGGKIYFYPHNTCVLCLTVIEY